MVEQRKGAELGLAHFPRVCWRVPCGADVCSERERRHEAV